MNATEYQKNCPYCHGSSTHGGDGEPLVFDDCEDGILHINKNMLWVGSYWASERHGCYIRFCPKCGRRLTRHE